MTSVCLDHTKFFSSKSDVSTLNHIRISNYRNRLIHPKTCAVEKKLCERTSTGEELPGDLSIAIKMQFAINLISLDLSLWWRTFGIDLLTCFVHYDGIILDVSTNACTGMVELTIRQHTLACDAEVMVLDWLQSQIIANDERKSHFVLLAMHHWAKTES